MDFRVTVRTYTGAVKTVEVKEMPDEAAARAEAAGLTFGKILEIERTDTPVEEPKPAIKERVQTIERELKPGETEITITGYNNNPFAVFQNIDVGF